MKKKILFLAIISALCISLTACGAGDINTNSDTSSKVDDTSSKEEEININPLDYEYSLEGLVNYLKASNIMSNDTSSNNRTYSYFDAVNGKAYSYNSLTVEIYEIYSKENDASSISEKAKSFINTAKKDNIVTVIGQDIHAFVSDNSKFLIVYLPAPNNEEATQAENNLKDAINKFCKEQDNKKAKNESSQPEKENNNSTENKSELTDDKNSDSENDTNTSLKE